MTVKDFLSVINNQVKYTVTDRNTKENLSLRKNNRIDYDVVNRNIYMIFQNEDGTLNVTVY